MIKLPISIEKDTADPLGAIMRASRAKDDENASPQFLEKSLLGRLSEEDEEDIESMGDFNQEGGKKINFDLPKLDKQVIQMLELDQNENEESNLNEIYYIFFLQ